jgi:putative two-component system response regulator
MENHAAKILVVDDEPNICDLLSRWLTSEGYECMTALSGQAALDYLQSDEFHLVVSDIMMPGMSGVDLLTVIKPLFPEVAVIMVTAVDDRNTAILTLELGAYGYIIKPFDRNEILINVANALERRRLSLLGQEYERSLELKVEQRTKEVREREEEIIFRLLSATGHRDDETGAHVRRIGLYACEMAKKLGWKSQDAEQIRLAAPMHDVGKIGIPDNILRKPGRYTPEEFEIMKKHTEIGARILDGSNVPLIQMAKDIALCHHERWDGSGYPKGLEKDQIPEPARIVAVVDVYDALVHDRIYRPALTEEEALSLMMAGSGDHFGTEIFDCFRVMLPTIRQIRDAFQEEQAIECAGPLKEKDQ